MPGDDLSADEARCIALAAQGFNRPRPTGRVETRHIRATIRRLGLLQLDYVNVLVPAHYQVLFARLGGYNRSLLDKLVYQRREFTEQWAHEASVVPVEHWPFLEHRRARHRVRPWGFEQFLKKHATYVDGVLQEIRARGALSPDDLPEPEGRARRISDKWGWGLAVRKQVLEAHFGFGRLAVASRRPNFARVYDLAERVIPEEHRSRSLHPSEAKRELLRLAARAHGLGTAADLADYYRMPVREARPRITELVEAGALREVRVHGWREPAYLDPRATRPAEVNGTALLSPFDPLIWYRPRVARLFGFDYRIEIFVPSEQRKWGYYVLPFLFAGRLVGRVDLKADRKNSVLLVLASYREQKAPSDAAADALAMELHLMARWLDLSTVAVKGRGNLARRLGTAVRRTG